MGASALVMGIVSGIFGFMGIILPFLIPKGTNKPIIQVALVLAAASAWLFWLCCYMAQMNPLIGPKMSNHTIIMMAREWGEEIAAIP